MADEFRTVVKSIKMSAKLQGLATLVDKLKRENPQNWRTVVFTQRRETQTTIRHIGFVFSVLDRAIIGRLAIGRRSKNTWAASG